MTLAISKPLKKEAQLSRGTFSFHFLIVECLFDPHTSQERV